MAAVTANYFEQRRLGYSPGSVLEWQEVPGRFVLVVKKEPGSDSLARLHQELQSFVVAGPFGAVGLVEVAVGMLVLSPLPD